MRIQDQAARRGTTSKLLPLGRWMLISLVLHVPLTPLAALFGLALLLLPHRDDSPPSPPVTEIPVDLFLETDELTPSSPGTRPVEPEPVADSALVERPAAPRVGLDAGVPPDAGALFDAGRGATDAAIADAGAPDAATERDRTPIDSGVADAALEPSDAGTTERRPLAVVGARGVVDPNANIRVLIDTQRLRGHALGARIGSMLGSVYQWRDFFGPTGIDPVRDTDRIFITGPALRDSSAVVALIQHRLEPARLRAAIDLLVQRDRTGHWFDGGVPVAKARADRADRFFVLPAPNLLVVTPESALKSALRLGPRTRLPQIPAPEIVTAHVQTPWRAFIGTGLSIPRSLAWAEARVIANAGGGATIRFLAEDESAETAQQSAARLEQAVGEGLDLLANATNLFGFLFGAKTPRLAESISFQAQGKQVVGVLIFNESQVLRILDLARRLVVPPSGRRAAPAAIGGASGALDPAPSGPQRAPSLKAR